MIVKKDKTYETHVYYPDTDWYNEGNYVVDETNVSSKVLVAKIKQHSPYFEFVLDTEGNLVDIDPIEPEQSEDITPPQTPSFEDRLNAAEAAINILLGL